MFTLRNNSVAALKLPLFNSPGYTHGLHITQDIRVFIFTHSPQYFEIDFVQQQSEGMRLFIVPPAHAYRLHISGSQTFACLDIPGKVLSSDDWNKVFTIKYRPQKSLPVRAGHTDVLHALLPDNCACLEYSCNELMRVMSDQLDTDSWSSAYYGAYHTHALRLLHFLENTDLRLDNCTVEHVATLMEASPRLLHRICMSVFGVPAKVVLKHHMLMKAMRLFGHHRLSVTAISGRLGFSTVAAFDKYVKRLTGQTPSYLRDCILRNGNF
ncbi:helix-turn-helix domain-containing protein [Rurimicrobium arvi]|uniref:HTH araC/xylS-type domain-containing protein n=1 Tax=Rurimicrobium arvi TaxID=2049916 RepID=A0ABP8N0G9_9BACT